MGDADRQSPQGPPATLVTSAARLVMEGLIWLTVGVCWILALLVYWLFPGSAAVRLGVAAALVALSGLMIWLGIRTMLDARRRGRTSFWGWVLELLTAGL